MASYRLPVNMEGHSLANVLMHTDVWGIALTSLTVDGGIYVLVFSDPLPVEELDHLGLTEA